MTARRTAKQKADEAWLRAWGQTDLEEQIASDSAQEARKGPIVSEQSSSTIETVSRVPDACPACGEGLQTGRPNIFTHMLKRDAGPWRIQCGNCGAALWCTEQVWQAVKLANAARFGGADVKPAKKVQRPKRERGAG